MALRAKRIDAFSVVLASSSPRLNRACSEPRGMGYWRWMRAGSAAGLTDALASLFERGYPLPIILDTDD
jgi:hypothetical protein